MEEVEPTKRPLPRLRLVNNGLTVVALLLGVYVILVPFLPQIGWWISKNTPVTAYGGNAEAVREEAETPISDENRLYIESLGLNEKVFLGGLEQLKNGILHRGQTSTPDKGSNTVLVGHRFAYGARGVFYHLDKVSMGDKLVLHWDGKKYDYIVSNIMVVPPEQISVEAPTEDSMLTLYTCTPLWTATNRLVIQAEMTGEES